MRFNWLLITLIIAIPGATNDTINCLLQAVSSNPYALNRYKRFDFLNDSGRMKHHPFGSTGKSLEYFLSRRLLVNFN